MLTETGTSPLATPGVWTAIRTILRHRLPAYLGVDRAIAYTVAGRATQACGSIGNILLIVKTLTPAQQGYYYALWSLVALQSVFELGFSFVILQLAAHERAKIHILPNGTIEGSRSAHLRLASALQRSVRWYSSAALFMGATLLFGGARFLSIHQHAGDPDVWTGPLRATVLACVITFSIGPVLSFLEGCGQVTSVAKMRLVQSLASTAAAWTAMLAHHGLYAPAMVLFAQGCIAGILIASRRSLLVPLLRMNVGSDGIHWGREVWPFQWKIAVSWLCDYFILQLLTPILFAFRGPIEAGRMGVSLGIVTQLGAIMLVWMTTKAAPFGSLISRGSIPELDKLFFRTLRKSIMMFAACAAVLLCGVMAASHLTPKLSQRLMNWPVFLLLLLTAIGSHVIQSEAIYLRAHKCEPFLVQSILIAGSTVATVCAMAKLAGAFGAALAYFVVLGGFGVASATWIFVTKRAEWAQAR